MTAVIGRAILAAEDSHVKSDATRHLFRAVRLEMGCCACPTEYEGETDDGRPFYVRYRRGYLSVRLGPVGGDIWSAVQGAEVFGINHVNDDGSDGAIEWDEVCRLAGISSSADA